MAKLPRKRMLIVIEVLSCLKRHYAPQHNVVEQIIEAENAIADDYCLGPTVIQQHLINAYGYHPDKKRLDDKTWTDEYRNDMAAWLQTGNPGVLKEKLVSNCDETYRAHITSFFDEKTDDMPLLLGHVTRFVPLVNTEKILSIGKEADFKRDHVKPFLRLLGHSIRRTTDNIDCSIKNMQPDIISEKNGEIFVSEVKYISNKDHDTLDDHHKFHEGLGQLMLYKYYYEHKVNQKNVHYLYIINASLISTGRITQDIIDYFHVTHGLQLILV